MHLSGVPLIFQRLIGVLLFRALRTLVLISQNIRWWLNGTAQAVKESVLSANYERCVRAMHVIARYRFDEQKTTALEDFLLTHDRFESPDYIFDNDHVTLMTINDDVAVFAEALPGQQLWRSKFSPFFKYTQISYCKRILLVPLPAFHRMSERLGDPVVPVIYAFNTGRCGSTLLNQVMEHTGQCVSLSEPDVVRTLARWYRTSGQTKEVAEVTKDCLRWLCRPYKSFQPQIYFIKFGAISIVAIRLFYDLLPTSRCMFVYRGFEKSAQSMVRLAQELPLMKCVTVLGKLSGYFVEAFVNAMGLYGKCYNMKLEDDIDFGMIFWLVAVREYIIFRNAGSSIVAVRYEDLIENPKDAIEAILVFCSLPTSIIDLAMEGLEHDSHRNTPVSAAKLRQHRNSPLTERARRKFGKLMIEYGLPPIDSDGILEGTITHIKSTS